MAAVGYCLMFVALGREDRVCVNNVDSISDCDTFLSFNMEGRELKCLSF